MWCIPYLLYTYSATGKIFYWGTSGGMSLYWMSTHYENEWGSWKSSDAVEEYAELAPHRQFFGRISSLSEVEKDSEFKKQAILNITNRPRDYLINWMANVGRMLFSYPFSFGRDRLTTYFYLVPNMFLAVFFLLGIYPGILRRKAIPYEIYALLYFGVIAFGGTSFLSAYDRQFRPLVPIVLLWLSFLYVRVLRIEIRSEADIQNSGSGNKWLCDSR
jgi:hypothetical protein